MVGTLYKEVQDEKNLHVYRANDAYLFDCFDWTAVRDGRKPIGVAGEGFRRSGNLTWLGDVSRLLPVDGHERYEQRRDDCRRPRREANVRFGREATHAG